MVTIQSQTNKVPKLVVGIVVDQMRYDYVYKYWDKFSEKGFKKLVKEGFFCRNAVYDYFPTYTGPGHASIYSGTTPSVHGIIGNNWYDYKTKKPVYCAGDWKSQTICFCKKPHLKEELDAGKKSPSLLLSTTIGDELKLKDSLSKVYSLSLKDRSAVLSGGHMADGAFWINSKGKWITSDYYCKEMPGWINDFHKENPIENYLKGSWKSSDKKSVNLGELLKVFGPSYITSTPKGNDLILDFTKEIISKENLGSDSHTDLLSISFSSTDYIGHKYGPDSPEILSAFQLLDQNIADLIDLFRK
jgi:predicted AlkP superfamily pyrophosphatase or phosphodiesterase